MEICAPATLFCCMFEQCYRPGLLDSACHIEWRVSVSIDFQQLCNMALAMSTRKIVVQIVPIKFYLLWMPSQHQRHERH